VKVHLLLEVNYETWFDVLFAFASTCGQWLSMHCQSFKLAKLQLLKVHSLLSMNVLGNRDLISLPFLLSNTT